MLCYSSHLSVPLQENSLRFKIHEHMDTATKEREEFLSIAEAYIDKNLYKEAAHIAESWLKRYPIDADANIIRCHALLKMGDLEKVSEVLDDLEAKVLELSRIYHHVGDLCLNAGLTKEAIKFYRKFIFLNPTVASAKGIYDKVNDLAAHIEHDSAAGLDAAAYNHTDGVASDFCTTTLAELYIRQGHLDMAINVLGEILQREPGNRSVADRLKDVMAMQQHDIIEKTSLHTEQDEAVIRELTRWLENVGRLRSHAS
ncbi:MAG: tetratricopeptide repeat protein [Syntrophales bacterium]